MDRDRISRGELLIAEAKKKQRRLNNRQVQLWIPEWSIVHDGQLNEAEVSYSSAKLTNSELLDFAETLKKAVEFCREINAQVSNFNREAE